MGRKISWFTDKIQEPKTEISDEQWGMGLDFPIVFDRDRETEGIVWDDVSSKREADKNVPELMIAFFIIEPTYFIKKFYIRREASQ